MQDSQTPVTRVTIIVEGGLVQGVVVDTPEAARWLNEHVLIRVRDWDGGDDVEPGKPYTFEIDSASIDEYEGKDDED